MYICYHGNLRNKKIKHPTLVISVSVLVTIWPSDQYSSTVMYSNDCTKLISSSILVPVLPVRSCAKLIQVFTTNWMYSFFIHRGVLVLWWHVRLQIKRSVVRILHWAQEMNLQGSIQPRCELVPWENSVCSSLIFLGTVCWLHTKLGVK